MFVGISYYWWSGRWAGGLGLAGREEFFVCLAACVYAMAVVCERCGGVGGALVYGELRDGWQEEGK